MPQQTTEHGGTGHAGTSPQNPHDVEVWLEIWTMPPVRKLRQKGGFAALVDSANVAGWLRGTRHGRQLWQARQTPAEKHHGSSGSADVGPRMWATERKEDAFCLNGTLHTDKWTQADVVILSDPGIQDCPSKPSRKRQGTNVLLLHRNSRELLAAASFFTTEQAKQVDTTCRS